VVIVMMDDRLVVVVSIVMRVVGNLFLDKASGAQHVVDWSVRLGQDLSVSEVSLESLNVVSLASVMVSHVVFEHGSVLLVNLTTVLLNVGETLGEVAILLEDVEAHLEDVVHLKLVAEALLLMVSIDVA